MTAFNEEFEIRTAIATRLVDAFANEWGPTSTADEIIQLLKERFSIDVGEQLRKQRRA
jgi:hypothetical protein